MSLTTAQLVSLVRSMWGQTTSNGGGVLDSEIVDFLNMRQIELCADTDVLVSAWTATTVAGQQQYSVPPEYTSVEAIQLYQTTGGLGKYWLKKVDLTDIPADQAAGNPDRFAVWGLNVSSNNSPAFWLYPIPTATTVATNDLRCHGRQLPQTMVSGGQAPEVRDREQRAIARAALADVYTRLFGGKREYVTLIDRIEARWERDKTLSQERAMIDVYKPGEAKDSMGYRWGW